MDAAHNTCDAVSSPTASIGHRISVGGPIVGADFFCDQGHVLLICSLASTSATRGKTMAKKPMPPKTEKAPMGGKKSKKGKAAKPGC